MKRYIVILAAVVLALTSCGKDFLNEAPLLAQSDELTLSTIEGIDNSVGGAYSPLASTSWYGAEFITRHELKTSNGKKSKVNDSGRMIADYNINYSPTATYGTWGYAYYVISCANVIIDKLAENEELGTEEQRNNLTAECLFLRALSHFDLVRVYAQPYAYTADASHLGVPVVLHQDVSAKPARNTVKEVYDQIIADLLEAEKLIDPEYRRSGTDPASAASIYAIQALLSRAYLYSQQWQAAADYATKVISSGKYRMWKASEILSVKGTEVSSVYWADAQTDGEVIFEVYGNKTNSYDGYHDGISPMTTPDGYGDAAASMDLVNLYEDTDIRGGLFITKGGDYWTAKYYGKGMANPDFNNVIVLRLSEMYLNRAEAVINGASGSSAAADLEIIANNRGASVQNPTKAGVYLERQKELAWEGHLWFDLARTGRPMTRTDVDPGVINEVPYPDFRWAMPIPDREISCNENLVQNDWSK